MTVLCSCEGGVDCTPFDALILERKMEKERGFGRVIKALRHWRHAMIDLIPTVTFRIEMRSRSIDQSNANIADHACMIALRGN